MISILLIILLVWAINDASKKELHIHVDFIPTKSSVFRENDNAPYGKYIPKIINNIIYCEWL